jgi:hypothetical protein
VVAERASPATGPAVPAPIDILTGHMINDLQKAIRLCIRLRPQFNALAVVYHLMISFCVGILVSLIMMIPQHQIGFIDLNQLVSFLRRLC